MLGAGAAARSRVSRGAGWASSPQRGRHDDVAGSSDAGPTIDGTSSGVATSVLASWGSRASTCARSGAIEPSSTSIGTIDGTSQGAVDEALSTTAALAGAPTRSGIGAGADTLVRGAPLASAAQQSTTSSRAAGGPRASRSWCWMTSVPAGRTHGSDRKSVV